jgi:hypothetical protein
VPGRDTPNGCEQVNDRGIERDAPKEVVAATGARDPRPDAPCLENGERRDVRGFELEEDFDRVRERFSGIVEVLVVEIDQEDQRACIPQRARYIASSLEECVERMGWHDLSVMPGGKLPVIRVEAGGIHGRWRALALAAAKFTQARVNVRVAIVRRHPRSRLGVGVWSHDRTPRAHAAEGARR